MFATIYVWFCLLEICALQNLNVRLYLQFVWVASIIIIYSNTTPVLSNHIFHFFLSVFFSDNFVALFTFCLQIFHLETSQKKWRDTKVQSPICHSWKMVAEVLVLFIKKCICFLLIQKLQLLTFCMDFVWNIWLFFIVFHCVHL